MSAILGTDSAATNELFKLTEGIGKPLHSVDSTDGDQTISGNKDFTGSITLPIDTYLDPPLRFGDDQYGIEYGDGGRNPSAIRMIASGVSVLECYAASIQMLAPLTLSSYTVATLPTGFNGFMAWCSDGDAGSPCLTVHNGTDWKVVPLGATVSAT